MESLKSLATTLFLLIFIASIGLNVYHYREQPKGVHRDTIRTTYVDTIPFYKPILKDSVVVRYVSMKLPTKDHFRDTTQKVVAEVETVTNCHRLNEGKTDSAEVVIPITQKVYQDSAYTAYVSGFRPNLDSLILHKQREVFEVKERTLPKRWGVGVQAGYGMTLKGTPQFTPYIGVGVYYNLFTF